MGGGEFILAINLAVAGLVATAFLLIFLFERSHVSARWFAASYAVGGAYLAVEFVIPLLSSAEIAVVVAHSVFVLATILLNIGLARMYDVKVPWRLMAGAFVVSVVLQIGIQDMARESPLRQFLYQAPYFFMQVVAAAIVTSSRRKRRLDAVLVCLLLLSAIHFLAKPLFAATTGGMGPSAQYYLQTTYALISQSMGAVIAVAVALLIFVILVKNVLEEVTERSRTDSLSGLLNRGGFRDRLDTLMADCIQSGQPVSLIICDLDHFKSINDTYGHACGDRVIVAFAQTLRDGAGDNHVVGRIGGEEFAVALLGANLTAARLFAEAVRTAFAALPIAGLPNDLRFTASFGIAEVRGDEDITQTLSRADRALYRAKAQGRDRVNVAACAEVPFSGPSQQVQGL